MRQAAGRDRGLNLRCPLLSDPRQIMIYRVTVGIGIANAPSVATPSGTRITWDDEHGTAMSTSPAALSKQPSLDA